MPNIVERIRAIGIQQAQEGQALKASIRAQQTELDRRLVEEQQRSRCLVDKLEIVESLTEINKQFLKGRGKLSQNTGVYEYEEEHWNYSSSDQGGYEGSSWHPFGATILQLRWKRDSEWDEAVEVYTDGMDIHIRHQSLAKGYTTDLTNKRAASPIRPTQRQPHINIIHSKGMEDDELRTAVDERIVKAFTF